MIPLTTYIGTAGMAFIEIAGFILLGVICYLIYLDADSLRRINPDLYRSEFRRGPVFWAVLGFVLFLLAAPIYFLRRFGFFRKVASVSAESAAALPPDENARQVANATGVVILWFLFVQFYTILLFPSLLSMADYKFDLPQGMNVTVAGFVIFIAVVLLLREKNRSIRETLYLKNSGPAPWLSILLGCALGLLLAIASHFLIQLPAASPATPLTTALQKSTPSVWMQFLILGTMLGPFFEEVIYRGFIFEALAKANGKKVAVLIVAFTFAFLHFEQTSGNWMAMSSIVVFSFGLTVFRASSASVLPSIFAHYCYNVSLFVVPVTFLFLSNPSFGLYKTLRERLPVERKISLLKKSIETRPNYWTAYNELAWIFVENNRDLPEALRLVDIGLSGNPDNPAYLDTKAEILYKLNRFEEAVAIESAVAEKLPNDKFFKEQLIKYQAALAEQKAQAELARKKEEELKIEPAKPRLLKSKKRTKKHKKRKISRK